MNKRKSEFLFLLLLIHFSVTPGNSFLKEGWTAPGGFIFELQADAPIKRNSGRIIDLYEKVFKKRRRLQNDTYYDHKEVPLG